MDERDIYGHCSVQYHGAKDPELNFNAGSHTMRFNIAITLEIKQQVNNEENRRTPKMFSPTAYNDNSGYRDQVEFRYAPSTWSDTESIDRGIGAMRINGDEEDEVFMVIGKEREKSDDDHNEAIGNSLGRILGRREDVTEQMKRSQPYMMALLVGKSPAFRSPLGSVGQISGINGREPLDSDGGNRYSPFTGEYKGVKVRVTVVVYDSLESANFA
ncbi:hypothetical protein TSMEX_007907 [Taenia solium]|eukprot:TsM_000470500 transcript=TsM_000470500 gene=TsM_000470500